MYKNLLLIVAFLGFLTLNSQVVVGDCTNGGAAIGGPFSDADDANTNWNAGLETFAPTANNEQVTTYHLVNSGADGALGFAVSTGSNNTSNQACIDDDDRTAVLYAVGDCGGTAINPSTDSPGSNYSNYEFTGLNPNTDYILVVTIDPVAGCEVQDLAVTYYSITTVSAGCDCNTPDCGAALTADESAPTFTSCETFAGDETNSTIVTYHTVTSSADGTLGLLQNVGPTTCQNTDADVQNTMSNRSAQLFAVGDCNGSAIAPTSANAGNSSTWNPEWQGLTPNTDYIVIMTLPVYGCDINETCLDYYHPPASNCTVDAGTYTVTIDGNPAADPNNVTLEDGENVSIEYNNDGTLPDPANDQAGIGYDIFNCEPTFDPNTEIPADDPCYLGTSFDLSFNIDDDNNAGESASVAGESELWFLPTTMDDMLNTANGGADDGRGPDINGDDCWESAQVIHVTYNPPQATPCGDCSTADCPVNQVPEFGDRSYLSDCNSLASDITNQTYVTYHTVTTDNNGAVGLVQGISTNPTPCAGMTRTAVLRSATGTCSAPDIAANTSNANGVGSGFNPEWYGLTPNTNYVAIVTTTIPAGCNYGEGCLNAYGIPNPPDPCSMQDGSVTTCDCEFTDSGGNSGPYSSNENTTFTICPDQANARINLDFTSFNIEDGYDFFRIYDGNTASGQPIVDVTGQDPTELQSTIAATLSNTSGCLTIEFESDFAGTETGWTADVSCYVPCTPPDADATVNGNTTQTIQICPGDQVDFDGSMSVHNAASITNYDWNFGNGSTGNSATETVTFNDPGRYVPTLIVENDEGCTSTNALPYEILVSTEPNFSGTTTDQTACEGEQVCLTGVVNYPTEVSAPVVPPTGTIALPDGTGVAYETTVLISGYSSGQTITNASDLQSICFEMEHSALDDITITLIAPTGEEIVLHNRGGGATALGEPTLDANAFSASLGCDFGAGASGPGNGWNYCFTPGAAQTMAAVGDANWDMTTNPCYQLPAGDYQSIDPFSDLIGAELNGTWTLRYEDASANDDGYMFGWDLTFDPSLLPPSATISPSVTTQSWTGPGTIDSNVDDEICVTPDATGVNTYTFTVTNDFGCTADTTIDVTVDPQEDASFNYASATFCNTDANPTANITGTTGGTFTSGDANLVIADASTGEIDITGSTIGGPYTITYTTGGTCSDVQTFDVSINDCSVCDPGWTPPADMCDNDSPIALNSLLTGNPGGIWTGTGVVNNGGTMEFDPSVAGAGTHSITYDLTSCDSTATITVNTSDATFSYSNNTYCNTEANPTPTITGTTGGTFSSMDANLVLADVNTGEIDIASSTLGGPYTVMYNTGGPCPTTSTFQITIADCTPCDAGWTPTTVCSSDSPLDLTTLITGNTGGTFSGTGVTGNNFDPDGLSGNISITYDLGGGCDSTATIAVTQLDAGWTPLAAQCEDAGLTDLNGTVTGNIGGTWSGDGISGTNFDPSSFSSNTTATVTYTLSTGGCTTDSTATIDVFIIPEPDFTVSNACEGENIILTHTGAVSPTTQFTWNWDGLSPFQFSNSEYDLGTPGAGTYNISLTVSDNGCASSPFNQTLEVYEDAVVDVAIADEQCYEGCDGAVILTPQSGTYNNPPTYNTTGGIDLSSGSNSSVCSGDYTVTVTDDNGCTNTYDFTVGSPDPITADTLVNPVSCYGFADGSVSMIPIGGTSPYTVTWESGATGTDVNNLEAGDYTFTITDDNGCEVTESITITEPNPVLNGSESILITSDNYIISEPVNYELIADSIFDSYDWTTNGELFASTNPAEYMYFDPGTYPVELIVSRSGCNDTLNSSVTIKELFNIFVPNAFTPDNKFGRNMGFRPHISVDNLKSYELLIYDRWGELIFSSRDETEEWNGRKQNTGAKCQEGVYVYKLQVEGVNELESFERIGQVSLLR